jgi:hypothetical protein
MYTDHCLAPIFPVMKFDEDVETRGNQIPATSGIVCNVTIPTYSCLIKINM